MPSDFKEERSKFYGLVANGNALGHEWLMLFHDYCHEVDDVIDLPDYAPERLLALFVMANRLYTHPFYKQHRKALAGAILVATSIYADSNKWEKETLLWKRWWADVQRHAGNEVIMLVANICGGWQHLRGLSAPLSAMSRVYHADKYGEPK